MEEIRFDTGLLRADQREEVTSWVASLGVEPKDVRPQVAIIRGENSYQVHLSRFVRDGAGKLRLDAAANEVVTEPLIIDIGTDRTWPQWLKPMTPDVTMPGEFLAWLRREIRIRGGFPR
ncbi:MAG TPA: hypothetical protein VIP77_16180 [Jiangellaceae bacterium]